MRALLALLLVTFIWGWTFVWMKAAQAAGREVLGEGHAGVVIAIFIALRFAIAAIVVGLFWPAAVRRIDGAARRGGAVLGLLLTAGFFLQMFGLEDVSPAVSAFLTSLYVLFTALLVAWRTRTRPERSLAWGVLLATLGAGFISGPPQLNFGRGEGLTILSAFVFAEVILATDVWTKRAHPAAVTWISFLVVTLATTIVGAFLILRSEVGLDALVELLRTREFVQPLLLSALLATSIGLGLMNTYQRELPPVRAAILYALEPIWAALIALAGGWEADAWLWIGGGALLAGNLVAELGPLRRVRRSG